MKPDMILQMLSNAKFLFTDKTLVWAITIVDIHMICEFSLCEEFQGTDFTVKQHNPLFPCVFLHVNPVAVSLCKCLETVVASVKGSICFHRLHIVHCSVLSECTDVHEVLSTMPTRHITHLVPQLVFTKSIWSAKLHVALLTLELICTSMKVDVLLKVTGLFECFLTNVTLEWSFTCMNTCMIT